MSKETSEWLNQNVLVGFTSKRGNAWHYRASDQGVELNHYPMAIPVDDVERRLFYWDAEEYPISVTVPADIADVDIDGHDRLTGTAYKHVPVGDYKAIGRSDTNEVFRMFKNSYSIHQYKDWLLYSVASILDDDELSIASAGLLQNGGVAWVSVELPDNIQTPQGFEIRPQLLATTSHNGTLATTFKNTCTAVVCDNTLAWGLRDSGQVSRTRHTTNSGARLQKVREALDIVHVTGNDVIAEIERLSTIKVDDFQFNRIMKRLVPIPTLENSNQAGVTRAENKTDRLFSLWNNDPRVHPWKGTALGVVQAWNTYAQHVTGKDESRAERNMVAALNGSTAKADAYVLESVMEVVGV
jgi:phage/plasmid-like protein (TIGR03299 family)